MTNPVTLLLDFDGTLYAGDLPVQAYGRRLTERLPVEAGTGLIAGMRRFLEGRPVLGDPGTDLSAAEDGYQAVELLAIAAGLDADAIDDAYRASRHDLARSAFAIDPPEGLVDFLTELRGVVHVVVVTNADETGVAEVLDAIGVADLVDEVLVDAGKPDCWPALIAAAVARSGGGDRIIGVGDRWSGDLADIAAAGGWTALLDRFGWSQRCGGRPDAVGTDLPSLLPALRHRINELTGLEAT